MSRFLRPRFLRPVVIILVLVLNMKTELAANQEVPKLLQPQSIGRWWWLLIGLISCIPVMFIDLRVRVSTHTMENVALLSSQETFLRQHGWREIPQEKNAWLIPSSNGIPRTVKPPLLVWLNLLAWMDLTPENASPQLLTFRARMVTVTLGLVMLASIYWLGRNLGDDRLGLLGLLVLGSTWFVQRQSRTASYDIYLATFACLAIAAQVWAYQLRPERRRIKAFAVAVVIGGVSMALGWLSKGPLILLVTVLPLIGCLALIRKHWRSNLLLLMLAVCLAILLAAPWYIYVLYHVSNSGGIMIHEYAAQRREFQTPFYYVAVLGLMAPWSLWLIAGLFQPFVRAHGQDRRRLLLVWFWFVSLFIIFSIPAAKQQRYALPFVPAAALLIAQVFFEHDNLARQGQRDPGARMLIVPHWLALMLASLALPLFIGLEYQLAQHGWISETMAKQSPLLCSGVAVILLAISIWGVSQHWCWRPLRAGLATAIWALVAMTFVWHAYSYGRTAVDQIAVDAHRIAELVGERPLRGLDLVKSDFYPNENEELLFYSQRIIPHLQPSKLSDYEKTNSAGCYLIATDNNLHDDFLTAKGWKKIIRFQSDREYWHNLWYWQDGNRQDEKRDITDIDVRHH